MAGKKALLPLLILIAFSQGCATIMHGGDQQVTVASRPIGADVLVDGGLRTKTPAVLTLSRKSSHTLEISYDGYQNETVEIKRVTSGATAGNLLFGGLIGVAVDASSGAMYKLEPAEVSIDLRPMPTASDSAAPAVIDAKPPPQSETPPK